MNDSASKALLNVAGTLGGASGRARPHPTGETWSGGQRIALAVVTGGDAETGYTVAVVNWRDSVEGPSFEIAAGVEARLFPKPSDSVLSEDQQVLLLWAHGADTLPVILA